MQNFAILQISDLEAELDAEQKRHQEAAKQARTKDRRVRELQFQVDEDKKIAQRTMDNNRKLMDKVKVYQQQLGDMVGNLYFLYLLIFILLLFIDLFFLFSPNFLRKQETL